jgi:hypothetical protein
MQTDGQGRRMQRSNCTGRSMAPLSHPPGLQIHRTRARGKSTLQPAPPEWSTLLKQLERFLAVLLSEKGEEGEVGKEGERMAVHDGKQERRRSRGGSSPALACTRERDGTVGRGRSHICQRSSDEVPHASRSARRRPRSASPPLPKSAIHQASGVWQLINLIPTKSATSSVNHSSSDESHSQSSSQPAK